MVAMTQSTTLEVFPHRHVAKEVVDWLQRASAEDRQRYESLFSNLEGEKDVSNADAYKPAQSTSVPKHPNGWTYTATKKMLLTMPKDVSSKLVSRTKAEASPELSGTSASHADASCGQEGFKMRPRSAPHRELGRLLKAYKKHRPATARAAASEHVGSHAAAHGAQDQPPQPEISPEATTYQMAYQLRDDYPELFAQAVEATKSEPVPNYTLISAYGDTLKKGVDKTWREKFMKSTYSAANEDVVKQTTNFDVMKEKAFFKWMQKQKTYYGELLAQGKKAEVEALLANSTVEQKREILNALRQLYAVTQPESLKSHSQAVHMPMARAEDDELTHLLREQTRIRTMGGPAAETQAATAAAAAVPAAAAAGTANSSSMQPAPNCPRPSTARVVDLTFSNDTQSASQQHPQQQAGGHPPLHKAPPASGYSHASRSNIRPLSAMAARQLEQLDGKPSQRPSTAHPGGHKAAARAREQRASKDTLKSNVPMKWGTHVLGPLTSQYIDSFGGHAVGAQRRAASASLSRPIKYCEVTAPVGAVNKHTALVPFREAYPVPASFIQEQTFPLPEGDVTMATTNRLTFAPRSAADVLRSLKAAQELTENSHKMLQKSTLPLGKGGINLMAPKQWKSEHQQHFVAREIDLQGDYERAQGLKKYLNGPTASAGRLTAVHAA